ncbi:MAG: hypothetical protein HXY25_01465 [Alphaproteobacteria bacterium]|nr:hypothetical protein [Alphaproteobacteria bacterium]
MKITRLGDGPIIRPEMDARMGPNIQGPSLIRVPDWVPDPLGRYYLYFADHKGTYIRLAYADAVAGPWTVHPPGSLQLAQSGFPTEAPALPEGKPLPDRAPRAPGVPSPYDDQVIPHIASPDAHVDEDGRRILLYYHGLEAFGLQVTRVAVSTDGLAFTAQPQILGHPYFRVVRHEGVSYALAMPGILYRSEDGLTGWSAGPVLFPATMRHSALLKRGDTLHVFWTEAGDAPERIWVSRIAMVGPWTEWRASERVELMRPELPYEGALEPVAPSHRSAVTHPVNQLRDPAIFEEDGRVYLLYAVAGESGLALAEIDMSACR